MDFVWPIAYVTLLWWLSTVFLLYRTGGSQGTFRATLAGSTVVAVIGAIAIMHSRDMNSATGAYIAFTGSLAIWGLHEVSYLLGFVTGPRARACPQNVSLLRRFWFGIQASLYHELAIVATAAAIALVTWESGNKVALLTFVVLWLMRWSTKLNIFLGVRNLHKEFWPSHLQYLRSYTRERGMNALFPWSVIGAMAVTALFLSLAMDAPANSADRAAGMLLVSIMILATLEHLFLMMPIPDDVLWRIGTRSHRSAG